MGLFSNIKNCQKCGKEIKLFTRIKHGFVDEDNKVKYYCEECATKRNEIEYYKTYIAQSDLGLFLIKNDIEEVIFTDEEIKEYIKRYNHDEEKILRFLDKESEIRLNILRIKNRGDKLKIREEAEKRLYGSIKTKREPLKEVEKDAIFSVFHNQCAVCGNEEGLHIHHKDGNPKNNRIDNLTVLCGVCHKKIHMKVR